MKIENEFTIQAPIDKAWEILTDVPMIAPCMPGAQLTGSEGDAHEGKVKVKVGPVTAEYKGTATFVSKDEANHRAELSAKGRDSRGAGNAEAIVVAQLTPDGDTTKVAIDTDLKVSGKVAQFGRGVMADVSKKLVGQFVECLEQKVLDESGATVDGIAAAGAELVEQAEASGAAAAGNPDDTAAPSAATEPAEPEALDLMGVAGGAMAKRLIPVAIVAAIIVIILIAVL